MATCTAQGHPECTITCPNGCIAIYNETNGTCYTSCDVDAPHIALEEGARLSLEISGMPASKLAVILGESLPAELMEAMTQTETQISFSMENVTTGQFVTALRACV